MTGRAEFAGAGVSGSGPYDAVIIGPAALNTLVEVDSLPQPRSHMIFARGHRRALGGTSAGKALHLADLGVTTACFTAVGDDADAGAIREALTVPGLDLVAWTAPGPSEHHLNLMASHGERLSIYLDAGPMRPLAPHELEQARSAMRAARVIVPDLTPLALEFLDDARNAAGAVWVDLHDYNGRSAFHAPFRAAADVVLMNDDALPEPVALLHEMVRDGAQAAVCTLGARGAVGVAADGTVVRVEAVPTTVVDTNGAGDAFMAGMIAASLSEGGSASVTGPELRRWMTAGAQQAVRALRSPSVGPLSEP